MGVHATIAAHRFPTQGPNLGAWVKVEFHYDPSAQIAGVIVRDDYEEPWRTIIQLDDGRFVLSTECQYAIVPTEGGR